MSNFENEYKNYAKESTPDLWDRIEAGVELFEASNPATENHDNVVRFNKEETQTTKSKKKFFAKYSGIIVAAAAVIIVAPAIVFMSKGGASNMAAAPAADNMDEAPAQTMAEAPESDSLMLEAEEPAGIEMAGESSETESVATNEAPAADTQVTKALEEESWEDESHGAYMFSNAVPEYAKSEYPISVGWEDGDKTRFDCPVVIVDSSNSKSKIRLRFDESVSNFEIMHIQITDISDDGKLTYDSQTCYNKEKIDAGEEMVLQISFPGDIPNHAIKFTDEKGQQRVLSIYTSGYDGSVVFSEI